MLDELLPFRWWYIFALFLVAIAPISLWVSVPAAVAPAAVAALVAVYTVQLRGARIRLALLKWGQVVRGDRWSGPNTKTRASGNDTTKTVHCNDGHLTVSGNSNTVTVDSATPSP